MSDRTTLLESAVDSLPDGVAIFGEEDCVMVWNQAAEAITGYTGMDLLTQPVPKALGELLEEARLAEVWPGLWAPAERGSLVRLRHKLGHELVVVTRVLVLRDGLGERIGRAAMFHPAESLDALPHGEAGGDAEVMASQVELEERLNNEFENYLQGGPPLGLLWIGVDQAHGLRKTHGAGACHAMLEKVQHALAVGLRPSERIGRWGEDEFLVIAHERSPEMLAARARTLAGLARTADFRWWGDRISLTVSIGAAQAESDQDEALGDLLEQTRNATIASMRDGGNRVTFAGKGNRCLRS